MASPAAAASFPGGRGLWLVPAALGLGVVAALLSFRVPFPSYDAPLAANAGRMLAAAAVGIAFATAGALRGSSRPLREAYLFALSVGGAGGIAVGLKTVGGEAAAIAFAAAGAALALGLVRLADGTRRISNLALGVVLLVLFVAATPAYMTSATEARGFGSAAIWLLGDVSRAHGFGAVAVLAAAVVGCAFAVRRVRDASAGTGAIAALLFGLGVGVGGPVAFVGSAAPGLVRRVAGGGLSAPQRVACSALVGAALVMIADALGRRLIGGYAPPLNLTIAFVAVPAFLWWNRRRLRAEQGGRAGIAFEGIEAVLILSVAAGILAFAYALTGYVRLAT